jgi:hypothetical protein
MLAPASIAGVILLPLLLLLLSLPPQVFMLSRTLISLHSS